MGFSSDAALLEEYLRSGEGQGQSLRSLAGLNEAAQKVGGMGTGCFAFENQTETMRALVEALKSDATSAARLFSGTRLAGRLGEDGRQLVEWFDFSLLPPYERIAKYFHLAVSSLGADQQELLFRAYWPTPPRMRQ